MMSSSGRKTWKPSMYLSDQMITALGWQVIQSINVLQDDFDDDGMPTNCCPVCCGPCYWLLKVLNDPGLLGELNRIIGMSEYAHTGWSYWSRKKQSLKVKKIKKLWFYENGQHKVVCMSSDGMDQSDQLHRAIEEAEAGFDPGRLKKRYVAR